MADRLPFSGEQYWNAISRNAFPGAKLYTYTSLSRTLLKETFTDAGAGTPHSNPVIADANGLLPPIYGNGEYFIDIYNADDTILIYQEDEVSGAFSSSENITTVVSLIADLRLVDTTAFQSAFVEGGATINDGAQARFFFDAASSATDNGVTVVAPTVGTGRWLILIVGAHNTFIFTSNDTYTPAIGTSKVEIEVIGGGGGGAGSPATGASASSLGSSGAAGAYIFKSTTVIDASYALVVGSGGTGGAAGQNNGAAGGVSSLTSTSLTLTSNGGDGGVSVAASILPKAAGASGGSATGGDINIRGTDSSRSSLNVLSLSGGGFYNGSLYSGINTDGTINTSVGGGGGGTNNGTFNDPAKSGGDGADGIIIIKEYIF